MPLSLFLVSPSSLLARPKRASIRKNTQLAILVCAPSIASFHYSTINNPSICAMHLSISGIFRAGVWRMPFSTHVDAGKDAFSEKEKAKVGMPWLGVSGSPDRVRTGDLRLEGAAS